MKIKKTIIAQLVFLTFSVAAATDYLVIIQKDNHKYEVVENPLWENIEPTYTEWTDTGTLNNCNTWNPLISQQKVDFSQAANCDAEQERTKSNRQQNTIDSTIKTVSQETENQFVNKSSNRNINVTNVSPIEEQSNYNCELWSPESSTVYSGTTFEQERYCDVDMMQKWNYSLNSSNIDTWEERYTEQTGYETQDIVGIKDWEATSSTYTAWIDTGVINNCNTWLPAISQQKTNFGQSANCDHVQERVRTDREENPLTGELNVTNVVTENQNDSRLNNRNIVVVNEIPLIEQNNYNCNTWSPQSTTAYYGSSLEQSRTCNIDMMKKWNYSLNSSNIDTWEERYIVQSEAETQDITGTYLATTCKSILSFNPFSNSGYYTIKPSSINMNVYCDMETSGGGWTVISKESGAGINEAFYTNYPVNEGNPELAMFRMSKSNMGLIKSLSSDMRLDCRGSDYLESSSSNIFNGEGDPDSCANHNNVLYSSASLSGHLKTNITMCTWNTGKGAGVGRGCAGAFHIDEGAQSSYCGMPNYPWTGTVILNASTDAFALAAHTKDSSTDCHKAGAERYIMMR